MGMVVTVPENTEVPMPDNRTKDAFNENIPNESKNGPEMMGAMNIMYLIDDVWKGFKRFFWIIPSLVLIFSGVNYYRARNSYRPTYQAFQSFVISTRTAYGYSNTYYNRTTGAQMAKTFPIILTSGMLQEVVKEDLGVPNLNGSISADFLENSSLFTIRVTSSDPQAAYDILQSVVKNYPEVAEYIIGETQLEMIDDSGIPTKPINPANYKPALRRGLRMGLLVSAALLFLYAFSRHTVKGEEDLKRHLSLTYLGAVPHVKRKIRSGKTDKTILMDSPEAPGALGDCLRTIRTRFIREADEIGAQTVLVTSATAGEGKTSVAINLAISLSRQDIKVILVDADLRNPSVAKELGLELGSNSFGTVDVLEGKAIATATLVDYGKYSMKVLPGGDPVKNPGALLGGASMEHMLNKLSEEADVVILDAPPCGVVVDAAVLARMVDGAIFVIRQDYARIENVLGNLENLSDTGVSMLGYVLNDTERGITGYGYGYGYGYGGYGGYGSYGKKKGNVVASVVGKSSSQTEAGSDDVET